MSIAYRDLGCLFGLCSDPPAGVVAGFGRQLIGKTERETRRFQDPGCLFGLCSDHLAGVATSLERLLVGQSEKTTRRFAVAVNPVVAAAAAAVAVAPPARAFMRAHTRPRDDVIDFGKRK